MTKSHNINHTEATSPASDNRFASVSNDLVIRLVRQYATALQDGEPLSRENLLSQHPEIADELAECLDGLELIHQIAPALSGGALSQASILPLANLGDFRILHEIGRGGMGVVYEAEQLSIGRQVALKVLPFAGVLDERQLARFRNESRAAGCLKHANIVHVYNVGSDRGVHYYAMELVEGQSLAEIIADLRGDGDDAAPTDAETKPVAALSTERETDSGAFFQRVARLGIQAAEALDHAHGVGIVHRDIKPSNLMVDMAGKLLITDFGLAQIQGEGNLTMTGDLVGTLRYMSPEQAAGDRAVLDHRTDIYSLGITLYELLTLRPAFEGTEKAKLLRDILEHDPPAPRSINSTIPRDLETIVLKTISKNPADRYASATELAADLRCFSMSEPIKARRPGVVERLTRWTRRHRAVVTTAVLTGLSLSLVAAVLLGGAFRREATQRKRAETEAGRVRESLDLAREAVDDMYVDVANTWISDEASMSTIQSRFLHKALALYDRLAAEPGDDFATLRGVATARHRRGEIYLALWQYRAAEIELEDATTLFELLLTEHPDRPELRADLAITCQALAVTFEKRGRWDAAIKTLQEGHDHAAAMVLHEPENTQYSLLLAQNTARRVGLALRLGKTDKASSLITPLRSDIQKLLKRQRSGLSQDRDAGETLQQLKLLNVRTSLLASIAMRMSGDLEASRTAITTADKSATWLWRHDYHDSPEMTQLRIGISTESAELAIDEGELHEAEQHLRRSLDLSRELLRGKTAPIVVCHISAVLKDVGITKNWEPGPFTSYAVLQLRLARLLRQLKRPHEAHDLLFEGLHTVRTMVYAEARSVRIRVAYANAWAELALLLNETNEEDAIVAREVAAAMWRYLLDEVTPAGEYVSGLHGSTPDSQWFAEQFPGVVLTTGPQYNPTGREQQSTGTLFQSAPFYQRSYSLISFRTESWKAVVGGFEQLTKTPSHRHGYDCLMLAVAHAHLGQFDQAAHWQQEANAWLDTDEPSPYWKSLQTQLDTLTPTTQHE